MCGLGETLSELAVGEHPDEYAGERLRVARLDEQAVATVLDEVGNAADAARDDRTSAAEGLADHAAHAFRARRQDEEGRVVERARDLGLRQPLLRARLPRQVAHELFDDRLQRSGPDEAQPRLRHARRGPPPRVGESVDILVALEHADEERLRA